MYKRLKHVYTRTENVQILRKGFIHMPVVNDACCSCVILASSELQLGKQAFFSGGLKMEPKP